MHDVYNMVRCTYINYNIYIYRAFFSDLNITPFVALNMIRWFQSVFVFLVMLNELNGTTKLTCVSKSHFFLLIHN